MLQVQVAANTNDNQPANCIANKTTFSIFSVNGSEWRLRMRDSER